MERILIAPQFEENDFVDFAEHHLWDRSRKIDPMPVFTSSPSKKMLDSLESISLERGDSSIPFNGKPTSSSIGTKRSISSAHDSIGVSITSGEETFITCCPNDYQNLHFTLEPIFETSFIEVFDHDSSYHRDSSWLEVKESEAKSDNSISNET